MKSEQELRIEIFVKLKLFFILLAQKGASLLGDFKWHMFHQFIIAFSSIFIFRLFVYKII